MKMTPFALVRPLGVVLHLSAAIGLFPLPSLAQTEIQTLEFPYLTLRSRTGSTEPREIYGGERSTLSAGLCHVRELDFGVLAPFANAAPNFLGEELLRVQAVQEMDPAATLDGLEATVGARGPALYVHGYNINFDKGCRRAALLQQNADLAGRFLWFSWPSDGAAALYTHDEADLYWSLPDMADTIIELERRFGSGTVDVIGHSLGARGVVLALAEVANRNPDIRLGHVVLLAPDMDFGIFERILPRFRPIAESITVYTTTGDRPLALSARLHGYSRLGEATNDVSGLAGLEVIDLSDLPSEGPTGHLYHIYSRAVGEDLRQLLNEGMLAWARSGLEQRGENLWRFLPENEN
jgi:esterase/lipase superfamily enzyme